MTTYQLIRATHACPCCGAPVAARVIEEFTAASDGAAGAWLAGWVKSHGLQAHVPLPDIGRPFNLELAATNKAGRWSVWYVERLQPTIEPRRARRVSARRRRSPVGQRGSARPG